MGAVGGTRCESFLARLIDWRPRADGRDLPGPAAFQLCALSTKSPGLRDLVDAAFTNLVQAQNPEEGDKIRAMADSLGVLAAPVPQTAFMQYRYQIDIDGNSNAWGFLVKLLMGSCVLKVGSGWKQWYYDDLRPWEHYVPVKPDLSDLEERIAWCLDNDEGAQAIALAGLKYAQGLVFGTEMLKAASIVLDASQTSADGLF